MTEFNISCKPNPDVAGLGVVLAYVLGALGTVILSFICFFLKLSVPTDDGSSSSPQSVARSLRRRLSLFRQRAWTESKAPLTLEGRTGILHRTLDAVLISLGFNQLIAGFGLFISFKVTYGNSLEDNHAILAGSMCMTSVFSQTVVPVAIYHPGTRIHAFRAITSWLLVLTYGITQITAAPKALYIVIPNAYAILQSMFILWLILRYGWNAFIFENQRTTGSIIPKGHIVWYLSIVLPVLAMTAIVLQFKLSQTVENSPCPLNSSGENQWTLGQILTIVMLSSTLFSAVEAYLDVKESLTTSGSSDDTAPLVNDGVELMPRPSTQPSEVAADRIDMVPDKTDGSANDPKTISSGPIQGPTTSSGESTALQNSDEIGPGQLVHRTTTGLESQKDSVR